MKRKVRVLYSGMLAAVICWLCFCVTAFAESGAKASILDTADVFSDSDEEQLYNTMSSLAGRTGFNIMIVASDDIGTPKTDSHVVEFCDDTYEKYFGINTDGLLLLINEDTKYDYISTSGVCINYFSDSRIDRMMDHISPRLKDGDHIGAANCFLNDVESYYQQGKDNYQTEILGSEVDMSPGRIVITAAVFIVMTLIAGAGVYAANTSKYKLEKPGTRGYMLKNSLGFTLNEDRDMGMVVNRVYSPRSSSSGSHHSSSSHRSSTHHSRSGGRHGGGGRHR